MPRLLYLFSFLLLSVIATGQQTVQVLQSGKRVSFRGLSVVSDKVIWVSGSSGTVVRSVDGGINWEWMTVPGYEKRDFRDIEAFDQHTAIVIAIAEPATILKTEDGGKNWKQVYADSSKGVFLDAMAFNPKGPTGTVVGDPLPGESYVYQLFTRDRGNSWERITNSRYAKSMQTKDGEAFFASSGTNVTMLGNHPVLVSGGKASRVFHAGSDSLPIMQGKESTGANSVAAYMSGRSINCVVVGGDFAKDTISTDNCVLFNLNSIRPGNIRKPAIAPHGYRSCVIYLSKNDLVTCGTSGIDISKDGGNTWQLISREGFHVVQKAKKGKAVFLAGGNGKIAKLVL